MSTRGVTDTINALGVSIAVSSKGDGQDYISLTDIARYKSDEPGDVVKNWMRNRETIEFLGVWERLHNPDFNEVEFDRFKSESGRNAFTMSPTKWIRATGAVGIRSKRGRYGSGTFAHIDIAFEFASWVSPEFKLYVIKDYQRLKNDENSRLSLGWNEKRLFAKINYRIHTDAVEALLEPIARGRAKQFIYANEADVLNVALFGMTARQWRERHPGERGNIRDEASLHELIVLANLESMNAELIKNGRQREERVVYLREMAMRQLEALKESPTLEGVASNAPLLS